MGLFLELSTAVSSLSLKQSQLLETFRGLIQQHGIELKLNDWGGSLPSLPISIDVEHDEQGGLVGIGICKEKTCWYFTSVRPGLAATLKMGEFIAHNGLSDFDCLRSWGINIKDSQLVHDTMIMGHILDSSLKSYGLKDMAKRELGIEYPSYDDIVGKRTAKQSSERLTLDKQPVELVALYNAMDTFVTYQLYLKQKGQNVSYFNQVEQPASRVFEAMSIRGTRVDLEYLLGLMHSLEAQQKPLIDEIKNELGPINLNSPKQLLEALNGKGINPELKGKPSTDKRALEYHKSQPIIANLLKFSELETLLSSFVYSYLERGQEVVHPFFNQVGTRTGRPSCSNPNLLQIPRRTANGKLVRRMFIPRDGFTMGDCDFGQIEPRVLAHLSKDPVLCDMFNKGVDFHTFTAERLGIDRDRAKVLNLSVGYRATFKSVSAQLRCHDAEAQSQIDKWWSLFPTLRRWQDALIYDAKSSGFCTTLLGRRIRIEDLSHGNKWRREGAERQLINNITQGSAAEIIKMAMVKISRESRLSNTFGLLVQVYDELLWESEVPAADSLIVCEDMENAVELDVPLTVDCKTGPDWASCH